jgi:glycosyltransferase involved in cell wall biosynthesis
MMEAASVTGPAKNLIGFANWLTTEEGARLRLSVSIATFSRNAGSEGFVSAARAAGIDTHVIRERRRFDRGVIPQLREIVARVSPDIIQTHNGKSHLLIRLLGDLRVQRSWFAFQHGYQATDLRLRLYNQVDRLTLRSADRVVSVCQAFADRLIDYGVRPERIRILHNAAVPVTPSAEGERLQLRAQLRIADTESVILTIGRLSREKGHADLLRAVAQLPASRAWKLVVVGIGPEKEALEALASGLGIRERVVFAGFHKDVSAFYGIADLVVLPSHSEGSSNVLLEAMMTRVPIVATNIGGTPEILSDENTGLLVPVSEAPALAAAIDRLLIDRTLASRLSDAAHLQAIREFSVDRYRQRLSSFYAEVL